MIPPNSPDQYARPFRTAEGEPDVATITAQIDDTCRLAWANIESILLNENVRYCKWPGQRDDGRKPAIVSGKPAEPWPGASDTRIRLADRIVNTQVALLKVAARKGRLTITGTTSGDQGDAAAAQNYVDWLRETRMAPNVRRETALAAEWRQSIGLAVMAVTWEQQEARDHERVSLDGLRAALGEDPARAPAVAELIEGVYNADRDAKRAAVTLLTGLYPDLDVSGAYRALKDLRDTGECRLPVRYLRRNEPRWEALKPWRDVFFPVNTFDLDRARWIAWRVLLNGAELEERAVSEQWDEDFTAQVRGSMGKSVLLAIAGQQSPAARRDAYRDRWEEMRGLCEVFYVYYWHTDEDGVPCLWRTVVSPAAPVVAGKRVSGPDEPLGYDCGCYPFVPMVRELTDRYLSDSRGVPETVGTQQNEVKHLRDARIDQTDLTLQPPLIRPEREIGLPLAIKPRGEIAHRRTATTEFMSIPNPAQAALPPEQQGREDALDYHGQNRAADPVRCALMDENLAEEWCEQLAACWKLTLQLAQQFGDSAEFVRVTGGQARVIKISREEIQGQFHLRLRYNPDTLDAERQAEKLAAAERILALGNGVVDNAPIARELVLAHFPEIADTALRDDQQAGAHEIEDEADILNRALASGIESAYADTGQNFALRLQWLQSQLAQPATQDAVRAATPLRQEIVQKRVEHLSFMVQQRQNAATGRVGVQPGPVVTPTTQPAAA